MLEQTVFTLSALAEHTEAGLGFAQLLERVADEATCPVAGRAIRALRPLASHALAHASMQRTAEILEVHRRGIALPSSDLVDIEPLLVLLGKHAVLAGPELRSLGAVLTQASALQGFAKEVAPFAPNLASWVWSELGLKYLQNRLDESLEPDGALSDRASSALRRLRARVKEIRAEQVAELRRLTHKHADVLRDQTFVERDGRAVLQVRADAHRAVEGIVLDSSASGATLFIEPRELTAVSNRLRVAQAEVSHEEQRLLAELCELARGHLVELEQAFRSALEAELLFSICRFAARHRAIAVLPAAEPVVSLRAARHPLLCGDGVVENDIEFVPGQVLVLSGPNAGGKSVALKCAGLFALAVKTGLPLCVAEGSRLGFYEDILADIGDSQSISRSLSTFSAHMRMLSATLDQAGSGTLVLLDEVAAGTDPEQGAALAVAILESLALSGATVAATTHYELLKEFGDRSPHFRNASVGFDLATLRPTFRLLYDTAGPSTALSVGRRYGLPEEVVTRAEALIPVASREREELVRELGALRARAREESEAAATEHRRQRALTLELEEARARIDEDYRQELCMKSRELTAAVRTARAELSGLEDRIKQGLGNLAEVRSLHRQLDRVAHVVSVDGPLARSQRREPESSETCLYASNPVFAVGSRVFFPEFNAEVEVLEVLSNGMVRVGRGALRLTVAQNQLHATRRSTSSTRRDGGPTTRGRQVRKKSPESTLPSPRPTPVRVASNTLDLRGERVEAALDRVTGFVDSLLLSGQACGFVLHGHGTGALKQSVRSFLSTVPHVEHFAPALPEDGGDAFTVVWVDQ